MKSENSLSAQSCAGRHFVSANFHELQLGHLFDVYFDLCPCVFVCLFVLDGTCYFTRQV